MRGHGSGFQGDHLFGNGFHAENHSVHGAGQLHALEIHGVFPSAPFEKGRPQREKGIPGFCFRQKPEQPVFRQTVAFPAVVPPFRGAKALFQAGDVVGRQKVDDPLAGRRGNFTVIVRFQQAVHIKRPFKDDGVHLLEQPCQGTPEGTAAEMGRTGYP